MQFGTRRVVVHRPAGPESGPEPRAGSLSTAGLVLLAAMVAAIAAGIWLWRTNVAGELDRQTAETLTVGATESIGAAAESEKADADLEALSGTAPPSVTASQDLDGREALTLPDPNRAVLQLLVLDRNGPVEGARVTLGARFAAKQLSREPADANGTGGVFFTDGDGRATLEVAPGVEDVVLVGRGLTAWVQRLRWVSPGKGQSADLKLRLTFGDSVTRLRVTSIPTGRVIAGAKVTIGSSTAMLASADGSKVITDANGVADVPVTLDPERYPYVVSVTAEGHSPSSYEQGADEKQARRVELVKHARLFGQVKSRNSQRTEPLGQFVLLFADSTAQGGAAKRRNESTVQPPSQRTQAEPFGPRRNSNRLRTWAGRGRTSSSIAMAPIEPNGKWSLDGIEMDSESQRRDGLRVELMSEGSSRTLATGIDLTPGEEREVPDPSVNQGEPVLLQFVYGDGRFVTSIHEARFERADGSSAQPIAVAIDREGRTRGLKLDVGDWRWSLVDSFGAKLADGSWMQIEGEPREEVQRIEIKGHTSITGEVKFEKAIVPKVMAWRVESSDPSERRVRFTSTDWDGEFTLALVPVGSTIRFTVIDAAQFPQASELLDSPSALTIDLPEGSEAAWTGVTVQVPE